MTDIILICIILFFAALIQATSGFGYAVLAMALLPLILPLTESIMVSIICSIFMILYLFIKYRKHINYKIAVLPLVFSLAGGYLGMVLLVGSANEIALKILGGFLIALSIYFFIFAQKIKMPNNRVSASLAGLASGLTSGFFNMGGPPLVLYYSVAAKDKKEYLGTLQLLLLCLSVFKFFYLGSVLGISQEVISIIPFGIASTTVGMVLGMFVFNKLPDKIINKVVYVIMGLAGIWYVIK